MIWLLEEVARFASVALFIAAVIVISGIVVTPH